jgi:hypothetical protein
MPRLENWRLIANHLYGEIYDDSRFLDGSPVRTSTVQTIDEKSGEAQTKNTIYKLGTKQVVE